MRLHGQAATVSHTLLPVELRHVRPVQPLLFDASANPEWDLGQTTQHLNLCILLYELLKMAAGPENCVGSDQFVYFDAATPKKCLAPDGFVKLRITQQHFASWKVWENGAPELCVEIVSGSDREPIPMKEKLVRYQTMGTRELVLFDHEAKPGKRLRVFDRIEGDFVERVVENDRTPCLTLGLHWVVAPAPELDVALRLANDAEGADLLFSAKEQLEKLQAAR